MTEAELSDYLKHFFPQENSRCEWKEYKNLKNSLLGNEKDDVISYVSAIANMNGGSLVLGVMDKTLEIVGINPFNYTAQSATLTIREHCTNISTEGLSIDEHITSDTGKRVWIINIPKHMPKLPVYAHRKAWQRIEDSLVELTPERRDAILSEIELPFDWSAGVVEEATLEDLNPEAISKARIEFKKRYPLKANDVDIWDDLTFLNKAHFTIKGRITRTALIILGNEEAAHLLNPAVCQIRWSLKNNQNENIDYEIFNIPMLLAVDQVRAKIRNVKYRYVRNDTLFPEEMLRYDIFTIREPLNNCIAHQDYSKGARIEVVEIDNEKLIFRNYGQFIPDSIESVVSSDCPESIYRNPFLVQAMRNVNMVETEGGGIKKLFEKQRQRMFPMPEYDLTNGMVRVEVIGKVINEAFAQILTKNPSLSLHDIMLLDKVQKHHPICDEEIKWLRKRSLIEGRKPNFYLSATTVEPLDTANLKQQYIQNSSFDDNYFRDLIVKYMTKFKHANREAIEGLLYDKLSSVLKEQQKKDKITNLLSSLKRKGVIYYDKDIRQWGLVKRKK